MRVENGERDVRCSSLLPQRSPRPLCHPWSQSRTSHPQPEAPRISTVPEGWFLHVTWANGRASWMPVVRPLVVLRWCRFHATIRPEDYHEERSLHFSPIPRASSAVIRTNFTRAIRCHAMWCESAFRIWPFIIRAYVIFGINDDCR